MFDGAELRRFVDQASWVAVNDYEGRMLCERTGTTLRRCRARTCRASSSRWRTRAATSGCRASCTRVPGVAAEAVVDPTGCGDAFRAALLYGLERGWPLERCVALGNRIGALKIACRGGQNHVIDARAWRLTENWRRKGPGRPQAPERPQRGRLRGERTGLTAPSAPARRWRSAWRPRAASPA